MGGILWTIITILFVLWLIGFVLHFGGGLIHLLLVIAVILFVFNLITGRKTRLIVRTVHDGSKELSRCHGDRKVAVQPRPGLHVL
jgi:hypothetical protein